MCPIIGVSVKEKGLYLLLERVSFPLKGGGFAAEKYFQNRISTFFVILFSKLPFIEKEKEVE
ncbi:Uncharacterised protein [Porphyromonas macacae]|uniref:Uncharacterized protein n=1 Tax=Porphyromonas macacae TaxID=28115 RepID=A0A379DH54_9PORP|nr:Uncharacterised protein [Porphyromonas macacae]